MSRFNPPRHAAGLGMVEMTGDRRQTLGGGSRDRRQTSGGGGSEGRQYSPEGGSRGRRQYSPEVGDRDRRQTLGSGSREGRQYSPEGGSREGRQYSPEGGNREGRQFSPEGGNREGRQYSPDGESREGRLEGGLRGGRQTRLGGGGWSNPRPSGGGWNAGMRSSDELWNRQKDSSSTKYSGSSSGRPVDDRPRDSGSSSGRPVDNKPIGSGSSSGRPVDNKPIDRRSIGPRARYKMSEEGDEIMPGWFNPSDEVHIDRKRSEVPVSLGGFLVSTDDRRQVEVNTSPWVVLGPAITGDRRRNYVRSPREMDEIQRDENQTQALQTGIRNRKETTERSPANDRPGRDYFQFRRALVKDINDGLVDIKEIPSSLSEKRKFYEEERNTILVASYSVKRTFVEIVEMVYYSFRSFDFLGRTVDNIRKKFGSGAAGFFSLLRFFFLQNLLVAIVVCVFLFIPHLQGRLKSQTESGLNEPGFEFGDVLTGGGRLEQSELFYGFYNTNDTQQSFWVDYKTKDGYFYTVLVCYLFYLAVSAAVIIQRYRVMYTDRMDHFTRQFGSLVFTGWEMGINHKDSAKALSEKNTMHLQTMLKKTEEKRRRKRWGLPRQTYIIRAVVNVLVLIAFCGLGVGVYFLVDSHQEQDNKPLILPFTIQGIMLFLPFVLNIVSLFEKMSEQSQIYVTLARTFLLAITMLGVIVVYWLLQTSQDSNESTVLQSLENRGKIELDPFCWETKMGQELYRILVSFFLVIVLGHFLLETMWTILIRCGFEYFGVPVFDTSSNTSFLLFSQLVTWIGFYYSPLLPLIETAILFFMFYIKLGSLYLNCRASPKIWISSTTQFVYQVLTTLSLLLAVIPYVYVITNLKKSSGCGPFAEIQEEYPFYAMDFLQNFFLFLPVVVGCLVVTALVICYYVHSLASGKKKYGKTLRRQLQQAVNELKVLKKEVMMTQQARQ